MFKIKKIANIVLSLCLLFSLIASYPANISAKTSSEYINIIHKVNTALPNSPVRYNISLAKESDIYIELAINERTTVGLVIRNQRDEVAVKSETLPFTDPNWQYNAQNGIYKNRHTMHLPAGDYILEMNFETEANYDLAVSRISENAKLNYSKLNLTKDFTKQLKAEGGTIKSCSSNNKKVATVTNSGKISAKNIGKATITVKLSNNQNLSCIISVKPNKYQAKKITIKDVVYNTSKMKAYAASFDTKGNLHLKFNLVNNSYGKIINVSKFKVFVKDSSNKSLVSYSKNNFKTNVASYSDKDCTIIIPKSALKKSYKKIDLRTAKISISGNFASASL